MAEKKICPLLTIHHDEIFKVECTGKRCAWWDGFTNQCAILAIVDTGAKRFAKLQDEVKPE